jgi:membrane protein implicated in regulation of membrane protease activity
LMVSMNSFHVAFIGAAIVLMAAVDVWGVLNAHTWLGLVALAVGVLLVLYGGYFAGRSKRIPSD